MPYNQLPIPNNPVTIIGPPTFRKTQPITTLIPSTNSLSYLEETTCLPYQNYNLKPFSKPNSILNPTTKSSTNSYQPTTRGTNGLLSTPRRWTAKTATIKPWRSQGHGDMVTRRCLGFRVSKTFGINHMWRYGSREHKSKPSYTRIKTCLLGCLYWWGRKEKERRQSLGKHKSLA